MFAGHGKKLLRTANCQLWGLPRGVRCSYELVLSMEVQIFGIKKSADTRKALRFFAERRIRAHFVDLAERPAAAGELKRFVQRFGIDALLDRESKSYAELGFKHARLSEDRWLEMLTDEPQLLRMPLVRQLGQQGLGKLTVGLAEKDWKQWVEQATAP
jgi:arsenate reductase